MHSLKTIRSFIGRLFTKTEPHSPHRLRVNSCTLFLLCAFAINAHAAVPGGTTANPPTNVSGTGFTANWNAATGATSYTLWLYNGSWGLLNTYTGIAATNYAITGLTPNTAYAYCVAGVNSSGQGTTGCDGTFYTAPGPTTALAPTNITSTSFTANWSTAAGATSYTLWLYNGSWGLLNTYTGIAATNYAVGGLTANTAYNYCVSGVDASGTGADGCEGPFNTASGSGEIITVNAASYLADVERQPVGVNVLEWIDGDNMRNRTWNGSTYGPQSGQYTPLATALANLHTSSIRFGGDGVIWNGGPEYFMPYGDPADYPADWNVVNLDVTQPMDYAYPPVLTHENVVQLCNGISSGINACMPSIIEAQNGYEVTAPCPTKGSVTPTRQQLINAAAAEVKYMNVTHNYHVPYWEVGNESYQGGGGCNGVPKGSYTISTYYTQDALDWSSAMKAMDPTIYVGANWSGGTTDYETLLNYAVSKNQASAIDFLVVHDYPGSYTFSGYQTTVGDIANIVSNAEAAIQGSNLSATDKARMRINVNESNYIDWSIMQGIPGEIFDENDTVHALGNFETLFDTIQYHPKVSFVNQWDTHWITASTTPPYSAWDLLTPSNGLTPVGQTFNMLVNGIQNKLVNATYTGTFQYVVPYASYNQYTGALNVFLVNRDTVSHTATINLSNYTTNSSNVATQVFAGTGPGDYNPTVTTGSTTVSGGVLNVTVPAVSVTEYSLTGQNSNGLNLLKNASMESLSGANWTPSGSGTYSYKVPNAADGFNAYTVGNGECISQQVSNLNASKTYNFSGDAFVSSGTGYLLAYALPSWTTVASIPVTATGPNYTLYSQTSIALPSGSTGASVYLCAPAGTANFDNIVFAQHP